MQARRLRSRHFGPHHRPSYHVVNSFRRSFVVFSSLVRRQLVTRFQTQRKVRPAERNQMTKYRRIEVNAFRRRVTVVSGEWRPGDVFDAQPARTDEDVSLDDSNSCEPVEPDSPEGQLILVDAVRSLQQRLSPEARALICAGQSTSISNGSNRTAFHIKLQSLYQSICARALRFARKEK